MIASAVCERRALNALATAHGGAIESILPEPTDPVTEKLVRLTRWFVQSEWFEKALRCGYSLRELFGVDCNSPKVRVEAMGLVSGMALSAYPQLELVELDRSGATTRVYSSGAFHRWRRGHPAIEFAEAWWEVAALSPALETVVLDAESPPAARVCEAMKGMPVVERPSARPAG
jgi:hypothetical protein